MKIKELTLITGEIRKLFHLLTLVGQNIHEQEKVSTPQRAILEDLYTGGPQTIPDIADKRSVTRQFIQKNVESLQKLRQIQIKENPAHKRSFIVSLTTAGEATIERMLRREKKLLADLVDSFGTSELKNAGHVLSKLKEALETVIEIQNELQSHGNVYRGLKAGEFVEYKLAKLIYRRTNAASIAEK